MMAVVLLVNHSAAKLCRAHPFSASGYADIPLLHGRPSRSFPIPLQRALTLAPAPHTVDPQRAPCVPSYVLPNREYSACDAFLASTCSSGKPLNNA